MAKIKGKRVMAKLIGSKSTTVWLTKEQQEIAKNFGVTNQEFAQGMLDTVMGFIVNLNPITRQSTILDDTAETELTDADRKLLSKAFAKELIKHLPQAGEAE